MPSRAQESPGVAGNACALLGGGSSDIYDPLRFCRGLRVLRGSSVKLVQYTPMGYILWGGINTPIGYCFEQSRRRHDQPRRAAREY
jgi:hypothetical protein